MQHTPRAVHAHSSGRSRPANAFKLKASLMMGAMLLLLLQLCIPAAFATVQPPDYTKPILDPALQPKYTAAQAIPNALMAAFTFTPYTNAAALLAGFPAAANCGVAGAGGEDCYTIKVRQFQQNLGLLDENTRLPLSTTCYGYGSSTNAPAVGPFVGGVWHAPAPTFKNSSNRPARITWINELPNVATPGFDPTYDCGMNTDSCYPYNRIVTHVHGAHVDPDSDGNPNNWFTPNFLLNGPNYTPSPYGPLGTYRYINTQEAATDWYHDHSMGNTHLNTQMGMAGYFLIGDPNEKCLQGVAGIAGCPAGASALPTDPYEIGFALQDRTFWPDGSFAMPDQPVRDLTALTCQFDVTGAAIPATCPLIKFSKAPDGHLIPFNVALLDPALKGPYTSPGGTVEYFGNMPMVNGVVFGKYDIEARVNRLRFIGGTDSRSWVMQLVRRDTGAIIPFWQVGSEQGLLPNPVLRYSMDIMPGERLDALIDLNGIPAGTKIVMKNFGPDVPYQGLNPVSVPPPSPTDPKLLPISIDIPEIMEFNVIAKSAVADPLKKPTIPALPANQIDGYVDATINLRPITGAIAPLAVTAPVRNVSLIEVTDQLGRIMPTIDQRGYEGGNPLIIGTLPGTGGVPVTENIKLNDVEQWDIINTTKDGHPMHLHLVAFQVINRQAFINFVPPVTDTVNGVFLQPSYTSTGAVLAPAAWEAGWKDTITCPPGTVTRVKAKYDIAGLYVWHCHILSHEEHDMMRPFVVSTAPSYTITASAAANGAVTGSQANGGVITAVAGGTATVAAGSTVTYTFAPAAGFEAGSISVDGVQTLSTSLVPLTGYTFIDVIANHYINVYFKPIPNTITVGIGAGGAVTGGVAGPNLVRTGTSFTLNFVPNAGFEVASIIVDGVATQTTALAPLTSFTFANVLANHYINVYFQAISNKITVTKANYGGSVAVNNVNLNSALGATAIGVQSVTTGGTLNLAFVPAVTDEVYAIVVDGVTTLNDPAAPLVGYSFAGVTGNHFINIYFRTKPVAPTFTIKTAANNALFGSITAVAPAPAAPGPYAQASTVVFNITPAALHTLLGVVVDGTYLPGPRTSFTFTNVQANHYINPYFQ